MINITDYLFGQFHRYINDQLNITYVIRFVNSPELDHLRANIEGKITKLNEIYRNLYAPFLPFDKILQNSGIEEVSLSTSSNYYNLDLKNYEFIKLDYIKGENETEFVFTVSHIIMDAISIIALAHYFMQDYSIEKIKTYIDFPGMKENYRKFLKARPLKKSKFAQLAKYIKRGNKGTNEISYITLRNNNASSTSEPTMIKTTVDLPATRKLARKYKISRENYLILKLAETIFKLRPNKEDGNTCMINMTKNLRLNPIDFVDEQLGNYAGRRCQNFKRQELLSFSDYIAAYHEELADNTYLDDLIHELYHTQSLSALPKFMLDWLVKKVFSKPSKGAPALNIAASFNYFPVRETISFPQDLIDKYNSKLLEFNCYLRVFKRHGPCFVICPDVFGNYSVSLTFNRAFMEKTQAEEFLNLYKELILEG